MNECGDWVSDPIVAEGVADGNRISGKTMERALDILSMWFYEILDVIWKGINECYEITETNVIVDGSHIPLNGVKSKLASVGYGGSGVQNQMQFMAAQLRDPPIPFMVETYAGNESDASQYADFLPMVMRCLKKGSMIVMDNGGAVKEVLDDITDNGMGYLTRVRMNLSDDRWIEESMEEFQCIDDDTCCISHIFEHSERTVYIFFSAEKYARAVMNAGKRAGRLAAIVAENSFENPKKVRKSDFITVRKNPFVDVDVRISVQRTLDPFDPDDIDVAVEELMGDRCGYFKLESSEPMEPIVAISVYRSRVGIEHMISSIKSVVKLKPIRVWKTPSVNGALLLALIVQLIVSLTIVDMKGEETVKEIRGKKIKAVTKPSPKTVVRSLGQLTITFLTENGTLKDRIYSNFDGINSEIMEILNRIEGF